MGLEFPSVCIRCRCGERVQSDRQTWREREQVRLKERGKERELKRERREKEGGGESVTGVLSVKCGLDQIEQVRC